MPVKKDKDIAESAEPQPDSPSEKETPVSESEEADSKVVEKPENEIGAEWESLSGKTQDRVVQLVRRAKQAEAELERAKFQPAGNLIPKSQPEPLAEAPSEEEVKEAVKKLRGFGVVTQDDLRVVQDRMYLDREHDRLGTKFDGSGGLPKYVSEEVEDYARSHYFGGNLEAAYKEMYYDELVDAEVRKRGGSKKTTYTEKPTVSVKIGEKPLTVESLRERLRKPDGADWWAKNREKIEPLIGKLSQKS